MFLYTHSQLGMNQRVEKEAKGRLDTQSAPPFVSQKKMSDLQTQKQEGNAAAQREPIKKEQEEFN